MNWVRLAAEIVRGAIGARESSRRGTQHYIPRDASNMADLLEEYRAQVDRGLASLSQEILEQNDRQQRALQAQRRWNYGLLAGLVGLALLLVALVLMK